MSKVIKAVNFTQTDSENKKVIALRPLSLQTMDTAGIPEHDQQVSSIDLKEIEKQAEAIMNEAEQKAASLIEEAKKGHREITHQIELEQQNWELEKQHWIEEAKQEGYAQGFENGKQEGFASYQVLIEEAKQVVRLAKTDYHKNIEQSEMTILHLGLKTAEKIMGFTLDLNPDAFLNLVKRVVKEVKDHQDIQIHVHPSYYDLVVAQKHELKALATNPLTEIYIYPNEELETTGCFIESSFGRIDASIDNQLNELKLKLIELLEEDSDDEER